MTPAPIVHHRPDLVVVDYGGDRLYLPPDAARRHAQDLARAADRAEGRELRPGRMPTRTNLELIPSTAEETGR
jgi:hypothetical protein